MKELAMKSLIATGTFLAAIWLAWKVTGVAYSILSITTKLSCYLALGVLVFLMVSGGKKDEKI